MPRSSPPAPSRPPLTPQARSRILVVGPVQEIPEVLGETMGASAVIAPFAALDAGLLARVRPDAVLAPVIGTDHDLADLAERLSDLGYRGVLRCYCRPLPRRADVLAALAEAFPDIALELVEVPR